MQTRTRFLNYICEANKIITPLNIADNKLSELKEKIESAELIVPVVGGFSAGKSTLINSFLNQNILPTAVTPETALATELRYSETDYIEAVGTNGSLERYELSEFGRLKDNARNFKNLRLYLNNDNLKAIQPLVLVDMPGFDAPIESHNQAILNYLNQGTYFIFLTSVEDGNITLSMKREIENIQQFGKGFAFCISKTNLRTPDDVSAVQEKIAEQLADDFDYTGKVSLLDMDGGNNLKTILQTVNPEELFSSLFIDYLKDSYNDLTQSINLKISTFKSNKQETEDAIFSLQQGINSILAKKDAAIADVEQRYSKNSVSVISQSVISAILNQKERLIDLAITNQNAFDRELNDLTKNALITSVQQRFQVISQDLIEEMSNGLNASLANMPNNTFGNFALDMMDKNAHILTKGTGQVIKTFSKFITEKIASQSLKLLLGSVFGVVGAVLMFLPEILAFFNKGEKERQQREQIEQQLIGKIIPQIQQQLNAVLPEMVNQNITELISQISEQFETQLQQKRDEIKAAEAEKAAHTAELENMIMQLEEAKHQLSSIANQYLFA